MNRIIKAIKAMVKAIEAAVYIHNNNMNIFPGTMLDHDLYFGGNSWDEYFKSMQTLISCRMVYRITRIIGYI